MSKRVSVLILVFLVILSYRSFGQISNSPSTTKETPIYIDGFDYPSFDPVSNYAWFKIHFPFNETTEVIIGGEHFRTYFADRITFSAELKQFVSKKVFLNTGQTWEFDLLNEGQGFPNPIPRREAFIGVGHEVQPNWLMEAKLITPVGKPKFDKIGFEGAKTRLEVGTKLKF